ncbi:hypothetical protein [Acinetobacter baumannii]|uniref:hypothetical protein n=1 Tax=Acinetobacter baumannii TaxID=470 RepID=UPI000F660B60|nr:hypothetical protein [Acinetobacter baumannii]RSE89793.1 hypothetical protein EGV03_01730 [Acinetobacter baumannii]RSF28202.1 hypothetical protein EGT93_01530 [Acinetobacter baumannii]RSH00455.1 hypothetical protein EGU41_01665 [Acinetobacter baumannii]RSH09700.1 hypothetical protein EGU45_04370 [Acinetobacter baumannii]
MAAKREIKTPGVTAEPNQEQQAQTPDTNQDTSTKDQADAALSEILSGPHKAIIPAQEDAPEWVTAILEGQTRLEQKLDAILSQSNAGSVPKPKGRFKLVDGKGHVWTED